MPGKVILIFYQTITKIFIKRVNMINIEKHFKILNQKNLILQSKIAPVLIELIGVIEVMGLIEKVDIINRIMFIIVHQQLIIAID